MALPLRLVYDAEEAVETEVPCTVDEEPWEDTLPGWVKLPRRFLTSEVFKNPRLWHVFTWCLLKAAYETHSTRTSDGITVLHPGEFLTGRHRACEELGMKERTYRDSVDRLVRLGLLERTPLRSYTRIRVLSWQEDQGPKSDDEPKTHATYNATSPTATRSTPQGRVARRPDFIGRNRSDGKSHATRSTPQGEPSPSRHNKRIQKKQENSFEVEISENLTSIPNFLETWESFKAYRSESGKELSLTSTREILRKLETFRDPVGAMRNSIERGWVGVFESEHETAPVSSPYPPLEMF